MGLFDWLFGTATIKELNLHIAQLEQDNKYMSQKIIDTGKWMDALISEKNILAEQNLSLINELSAIKAFAYMTIPPMPTFLDMSQAPYQPSILIMESGTSYNVNIKPQDIYAISPSLIKVVQDMNLRGATDDETFRRIWKFVLDRMEYRYDLNESWEYPTTSYYRRKGDCEDGTILFVTMCRLCGIQADKIFNVTGWVHSPDGKLYGHSYPIVKLSDGNWYIMETTLSNWSDNLKAVLFRGSINTADWGMANWIFAGKIKEGNQV